jgi:hypothetical protein
MQVLPSFQPCHKCPSRGLTSNCQLPLLDVTGLDLDPLAQPDAQTSSAGGGSAYVLRESSVMLPRVLHVDLWGIFSWMVETACAPFHSAHAAADERIT